MRPPFSLSPSHRAPRSLFFFLPSFPTTQRGLCELRREIQNHWYGRDISLLSMTCFPYWTLIKRRLTHAFTKEQDLKRNISLTRVLILSLLRHSSTHILNPVIHTRSKKASWRVKASDYWEGDFRRKHYKIQTTPSSKRLPEQPNRCNTLGSQILRQEDSSQRKHKSAKKFITLCNAIQPICA